LKSTETNKEAMRAAKKPKSPQVTKFLVAFPANLPKGFHCGNLIMKASQKTDKTSVNILKGICLEVMKGNSQSRKTKSTQTKEDNDPIFNIQR